MPKRSAPGLELNDDRRFQERSWRFERAAWVVLALIVIASLAGLSGKGGVFAHGKISSETGTVEYPRVTRWAASDDLHLTLPAGTGNEAVVEIGSSFSEIFEFEDIQPTPSGSYATGTGQRLIFDLGPPSGERQIIMHVRAMRPSFGREMDLRIGDGPTIKLRPVVLP